MEAPEAERREFARRAKLRHPRTGLLSRNPSPTVNSARVCVRWWMLKASDARASERGESGGGL